MVEVTRVKGGRVVTEPVKYRTWWAVKAVGRCALAVLNVVQDYPIDRWPPLFVVGEMRAIGHEFEAKDGRVIRTHRTVIHAHNIVWLFPKKRRNDTTPKPRLEGIAPVEVSSPEFDVGRVVDVREPELPKRSRVAQILDGG